jgi:hypothetical protein
MNKLRRLSVLFRKGYIYLFDIGVNNLKNGDYIFHSTKGIVRYNPSMFNYDVLGKIVATTNEELVSLDNNDITNESVMGYNEYTSELLNQIHTISDKDIVKLISLDNRRKLRTSKLIIVTPSIEKGFVENNKGVVNIQFKQLYNETNLQGN